jgi:hypothetical protein
MKTLSCGRNNQRVSDGSNGQAAETGSSTSSKSCVICAVLPSMADAEQYLLCESLHDAHGKHGGRRPHAGREGATVQLRHRGEVGDHLPIGRPAAAGSGGLRDQRTGGAVRGTSQVEQPVAGCQLGGERVLRGVASSRHVFPAAVYWRETPWLWSTECRYIPGSSPRVLRP